ncbi:MAG: hypothetical protein OER88_04070 [Planctomycetota bacterium]|nr:hypothetical protein [Planctomycetota bacterium]
MMRCGLVLLLGTALAIAQGGAKEVAQDWPNGKKKVRGQTVDGKRHGLWREWHENGKPFMYVEYKAGKMHGIRREWYDNGQVMVDWIYTAGRPNKGVVVGYHRNGKVKHKFKSGGKGKHPNQVNTFWYDNGKKQAEGKWVNELQHGKWTYWYRSGKRQRVVHFKKGQRDGWVTEWDEKGKVVSKQRFKNGKLKK